MPSCSSNVTPAALAGRDAAPPGGTNAKRPRQSDLPDRLLDVNEAAALFGVAPATIYDWAYKRKLPVVKPSGPRGPLRFRLSLMLKQIEKWERPALRSLPERLDGRGRAGGGQQP